LADGRVLSRMRSDAGELAAGLGVPSHKDSGLGRRSLRMRSNRYSLSPETYTHTHAPTHIAQTHDNGITCTRVTRRYVYMHSYNFIPPGNSGADERKAQG